MFMRRELGALGAIAIYLAEAAIVGHLDVLGAAVAANRLEPVAFGQQHIPQLVQVLERLETQLGRLPSAACPRDTSVAS